MTSLVIERVLWKIGITSEIANYTRMIEDLTRHLGGVLWKIGVREVKLLIGMRRTKDFTRDPPRGPAHPPPPWAATGALHALAALGLHAPPASLAALGLHAPPASLEALGLPRLPCNDGRR